MLDHYNFGIKIFIQMVFYKIFYFLFFKLTSGDESVAEKTIEEAEEAVESNEMEDEEPTKITYVYTRVSCLLLVTLTSKLTFINNLFIFRRSLWNLNHFHCRNEFPNFSIPHISGKFSQNSFNRKFCFIIKNLSLITARVEFGIRNVGC